MVYEVSLLQDSNTSVPQTHQRCVHAENFASSEATCDERDVSVSCARGNANVCANGRARNVRDLHGGGDGRVDEKLQENRTENWNQGIGGHVAGLEECGEWMAHTSLRLYAFRPYRDDVQAMVAAKVLRIRWGKKGEKVPE